MAGRFKANDVVTEIFLRFKVVQDLMRIHCRCHGVSGSCTSQTCWMQIPTFQEVGNALKRKYMDGAVRAEMHKRRRRLRHITGTSIWLISWIMAYFKHGRELHVCYNNLKVYELLIYIAMSSITKAMVIFPHR